MTALPPDTATLLPAELGGEAFDAALRDDPRQEIRLGLAVAAIFATALFGWGLWARLDAAVYAPGQIEVAGNRQTVQHRDGGIVSALAVHEGDRVSAGQVLLQLNSDEIYANERSTADQVIELQALRARLSAELQGRASVEAPRDFDALQGPDREAADAALALQRREFTARNAALATEKDVLVQKSRESSEQIAGYERQAAASRDQQRLIGQEIASLGDLYARGLVPATRLRSLQRNAAELQGGEGEYSADIARTREEIGESRLRSTDLDRERAADDSKALQDAAYQLGELQPKLAALRQQLERTVVRAPVGGRVVGLAIFTVGGVISPGEKLMDIVPDRQPLVIQARVKAADVGDLKLGQPVEFRIAAFHDRGMPILRGVLDKVSADSFTDERTGAPYFVVEASAPPSELAAISNARGGRPGLKPGLPVELVVPLRPRTALGYLTEPLRHMLWRSFREP